MTYTVAPSTTAAGLPRDQHAPRAAGTSSSPTTSPTRSASVVIHTRFVPLKGRRDATALRPLRPDVNGNGGGGTGNGGADDARHRHRDRPPRPVAFDTGTATNAANRDYARAGLLRPRAEPPVQGRRAAATPAPPATGSPSSTPTTGSRRRYDSASDGNVVQTAEVDLGTHGSRSTSPSASARRSPPPSPRPASPRDALRPAPRDRRRYGPVARYDAHLQPRRRSPPALDPAPGATARAAVLPLGQLLKASEDKTFPGAVVAALASPWGQAVTRRRPRRTRTSAPTARSSPATSTRPSPGSSPPATRTPRGTPSRFLSSASSSPTARCRATSLVNGKTAPDSFGMQLDEVAYPILMARPSA